MDLNPDDAHQYFEGVDYPATKEDLSSAAKDNGAPNASVGRIGALGPGRVLQLGGRRRGATRFSAVDLTTAISRIKRGVLERKG